MLAFLYLLEAGLCQYMLVSLQCSLIPANWTSGVRAVVVMARGKDMGGKKRVWKMGVNW